MAERCGKEGCGGVNGCKECSRIYQAERRAKKRGMPAQEVDPGLPVIDVDVIEIEMVKEEATGPAEKPGYVPEGLWAGLTDPERMKIWKRTVEEHAKIARIFKYLDRVDDRPRCAAQGCGELAEGWIGRMYWCGKHGGGGLGPV